MCFDRNRTESSRSILIIDKNLIALPEASIVLGNQNEYHSKDEILDSRSIYERISEKF